MKYFNYPFYIIFTKSDKYDIIHKKYLLKNILDICKNNYCNDTKGSNNKPSLENINKIPYIEINNITRNGYKKLDDIIKYYSHKSVNQYNILRT